MDDSYFNILFLNTEIWDDQKIVKLSGSAVNGPSLYRGWMMKPEEYGQLCQQLENQNIHLITSPEQYEDLHLFSNAYPLIKPWTPKSLFFDLKEDGSLPDLSVRQILEKLGPFMVKDYVKSVKGGQFPDFFSREDTQDFFDRSMELFLEYRLDSLTGGICCKEMADLKKYDGKTNEVRVFFLFGKILSVQYELDRTSTNSTELPAKFAEKFVDLPSPFYTVDFAEKTDGTFVVLETGDGQVSSLRDFEDPARFYSLLKTGFQNQ